MPTSTYHRGILHNANPAHLTSPSSSSTIFLRFHLNSSLTSLYPLLLRHRLHQPDPSLHFPTSIRQSPLFASLFPLIISPSLILVRTPRISLFLPSDYTCTFTPLLAATPRHTKVELLETKLELRRQSPDHSFTPTCFDN